MTGFRMPAEWAKHVAVWTAWPHLPDQWGEGLDEPRRALAAMIRAIATRGGERVELLVRPADEAGARAMIDCDRVTYRHALYGDVWLRDTGPCFVTDPDNGSIVSAARFRFDGWGGKYVMPGDPEVASTILAWTKIRGAAYDFVLEGGAIDVDGAGTVLTTKQCLLGDVRNPDLDQAALDARLRWALGCDRVVWLDRGLLNDHTDGHIDTLARFVAPGVVACMEPANDSDPNADAMRGIIADLRAAKLEVVTVPSPGEVTDATGFVMPASYMNFYIANDAVIVPTYRAAADDRAVAAIAKLFPDRAAIALDCKPVLVGGGGFHCATQQQPA